MNTSKAWVEVALKILTCSQKELAQLVSVSPTQISKWKQGEHMSLGMENKFRAITKIGDKHPEFVLWAGSLGDADKWDELIRFLAEEAREDAETGYDTYPLMDEMGLLAAEVTNTLRKMGVEPPKTFPPELISCSHLFRSDVDDQAADGNAEDDALDTSDQLWELLNENSYSAVIRAIFKSLNNVWGFYAAYIEPMAEDDDTLLDTKAELEACLIDLAACKIQVDHTFAPNIQAFNHIVKNDYRQWLSALKDAAFRSGTPLRAELLAMVNGGDEELGYAAEAESLGLNASRLHPDIYMNELIVGMRTIHQVLPAILKKLDIEDCKLDQSDFHINI